MKNILKKFGKSCGFSLVEVTVAALIFVIAAVGIISTVAVLRTPSRSYETGIPAAYYGQNILDNLRSSVDQRTWANPDLAVNPLAPGNHTIAPVTIANTTYNAVYTVDPDDPTLKGRRVRLTISW